MVFRSITECAPNGRAHLASSGRSSSTCQDQVTAPVDRLPEELLIDIFKVLVEPDPPAIGSIFLVSRYWHHIIQATPSMWSRIAIRPRSPDEVTKSIQYLHIAVKNSVNLPLDITVDLHYLKHHYDTTDSLHSGSNYDISDNSSSAPYETQEGVHEERLIVQLLQAVVGDGGVNVLRWRRFMFTVQPDISGLSPGDGVVGEFLVRFNYPAPHLESLSLHLYAADMYFSRIRGPLQDLRSLKHLVMDAGGHLGYIKFTPERVETLCFRLWGPTRVLSSFINLRNLAIVNWANSGVSYAANQELTFPLLECLTLQLAHPSGVGDCTVVLPHKIQAPLLTTLRLLDDEAMDSIGNANAYHHVRTLDLLGPSSNKVQAFIGSHLYKYTALTTLTVCPWNLSNASDQLRGLKFRGQAPVDLVGLHTVISDKQGVLLDKQNIRSMMPSWRQAEEYIYRQHKVDTCVIQ